MGNIPVYKGYRGEKRIALLDNSSIEFMEKIDREGRFAESFFETYDAIFIPGWCWEEIADSKFRVSYISKLAEEGYPIYKVEESTYTELMGERELALYGIVYASVWKVSEIKSYLKRNVEKSDMLDMEPYREWVARLYDEWPILGKITVRERRKRRNAGEISLTILAEIFSWYYRDVEIITIYSQDADTREFQISAHKRLQKESPVKDQTTIGFKSNDLLLCQLYRKNRITQKQITSFRKDERTVYYVKKKADGTNIIEERRLSNREFIEVIQDKTVEIIF